MTHDHSHSHAHASDHAGPAGSPLLAMSALRRLGWATVLIAGLWGCVVWAMAYDPAARIAAVSRL